MAIIDNLPILRADEEIRSFSSRSERKKRKKRERDGCGVVVGWMLCCIPDRLLEGIPV